MRSALTLLALVGALLTTGCRSYRGDSCGGCEPTTQSCRKWQPGCCNNWNWYEPCPMIEQSTCDSCRTYVNQTPSCAPCAPCAPVASVPVCR